MSSIRPAAVAFKEIRPSCGLRRSAMSSFASTFKRVVTPAVKRFGMLCATRSTPSIRNRTTSALSCGSKWMSLARSSAAWKTIEFTSRTSGPSEIPSSASRSSSSSVSTMSTSSISSAFIACDARVSRRSSVSTSSRAATKNSTRWRVANRISSNPRTFCGSVIATRRLVPSNANGIAHTCSSTCNGTALLASGSTFVTARSTRFMWYRSASARAARNELAAPSSPSTAGGGTGSDSRPFGVSVSGSPISVTYGSTYKIPR